MICFIRVRVRVRVCVCVCVCVCFHSGCDTTHFASMLQLVHFDFFVTKCVGNVDAFCIKLKFLVQNASTL